MDELKLIEKQSTNKKSEKGPDWFLSVTTVQIVLCIIIGITVFLISSSDGENSKAIRNDYSKLMSINITKSDAENVFAQFKNWLGKMNFVDFDEQAQTSIEQTAEDENIITEEESTEAKKTKKKSTEKTDETTSEMTTAETTDEPELKGSGGEDVAVFSAKENTTFSPVATTCPIVRPVDGGWYSSYFGYRVNPITNEDSFHTGLDIAVAQGAKIHAAYNGTVRLAGEDDHSGKYVLLSHDNGFETFYCHCSEILVDEGTRINAGETIALVGSTGWSTGPHLHFEVRKNGERLDPLRILENDS